MPSLSPLPKIKALLFATVAALISACSPFAAINLIVPKDGYTVHSDLAYGADPRQKLDVYVPNGVKGAAPVLLFFYGGNWESGRREDYKAFGQAFASIGIVTVIADYRLYPQVKYPAFVEDAANALAYVHAHVAEYGGDTGRIFIAGHSAGAYNAVMLGSDPHYIQAAGGNLNWIRGVIGISGPYDFLPLTASDLIDIFHGPDNREAMPIAHIDAVRPPMLLITGTSDDTVNYGNSDRMAARLKAVGSSAQVIHYPGVGHIGTILSIVPGFRTYTSLRDDVAKFIQAH